MTTDTRVRARLAQHAAQGRWTLFVAGGAGLALVGAALFAAALAGGQADRAWQLFHVNWIYFTGLTGGSLAVVAAQKIARARWSGLIIRFAEAVVAAFPLVLLGFLLVFTVGYDAVYGPMQEELHGLQHGKAVWLSYPFMFGRLAVGLLLLAWLGWRLVRADMVPDAHDARAAGNGRFDRLAAGYDGSLAAAEANQARIARTAACYALTYAMVFTLVAFDGIMALQPHWFSNLLGGFYFMGSFLGGHALLAWLSFYGGRQTGISRLISAKQRHDLGKLVFGFSVFWAYLMWAQFLVIWYGNLPEETGFVFARLWGPWRPVGVAVFCGMFLIPFVGLIGVLPKKLKPTLGLFTLVSLTALWLERYLLVMPSVTTDGPGFGLPGLGATALFLGLFLLSYGLLARRIPMVSPRLAQITLEREVHHTDIHGFLHEERAEDYVSEQAVEEDVEGR